MTKFIQNFVRDESGAAAAEYALILAIVGAGIAAGALALGSAIGNKLTETGQSVAAVDVTP